MSEYSVLEDWLCQLHSQEAVRGEGSWRGQWEKRPEGKLAASGTGLQNMGSFW